MIKLFWCARTRAQRAVWLLEELGLEYELVPVDIRGGELPADFLKASPMGKVPAIQDGEAGVSDSGTIALYLADKYPTADLAVAPDAPSRADYLYWMLYTPGVIEPAMGEKFSGMTPNKLSHGWGDFATMIKVLEDRLKDGRTWLMGDRFTAADVLVGSSCNFMRLFGIMPDSKVLNDYTDRCVARPAFQKAQALDAA